MYTLREEVKKDLLGTLEKVAAIGYTGVEFFGGVFGGLKASKLKKELDRLGLEAVAAHTNVTQLKDNIEEVMDYNLEIGNSNIVVPWAKYGSRQDFVDMAKFCNEIGQKCKNKGLQLYYHNHAAEFEKFDGEYGLDIIFRETDAELLKAEIDTYWVQHAGVNPLEYIKKNSGRCNLIHLKDMEAGEGKDFAEVGNGIMDIKSIITTAKENGVKHFIVEQDVCKRPAFESVKISYDNLKKLNLI
jgi:sugar phosphate isomerase/epimerase